MSREFDQGWQAAMEATKKNEWRFTDRELPPREQVVMTEDSGGNQQKLKRHNQGALWFFADGSGYVYYTPTRWRYLDDRDK